ncbi:MAG: cytochrome c biogenesis protein CcdA [Nanoarchaeota archaeon]|nr:cytochrome c biogenesis protein CcdA [Nanoarchaeota archaeon]
MKKIYLLLLLAIVLLSFNAFSHLEDDNLPENLHKIIDYNNQQANFYFKNLSFIIAFLAGILSILTPCSLGILPAFFSYTFKEKKNITKMTLAFFLGFMPVFIAFGIIATFLGTSISMLQQDNRYLVTIAGAFIVVFGLMTLFGKGFTFIKIRNRVKKDALSIFLFGIFFGIGFTACMGPILVGMLLIASVLNNYIYSMLLMFFYSLGFFVPLFLISFLFDKYDLSKNKFIKGKEIEFIVSNKKITIHSTNLISAILLITVGLVFIVYGGTFIVNNLGLGGVTSSIYSLQEKLVSLKFINIIGAVVLLGFIFLLWKFLKKKK